MYVIALKPMLNSWLSRFMICAVLGLAALSPFGARAAELAVEPVDVDEHLVRPGETVELTIHVENNGDTPAREVRFVPAVTARGIPWQVTDTSESGPIPELAPGASVELTAQVRLDGEGSVRVGGFVTTADGTASQPEGQTVRVGSPASLAAEGLTLFTIFLFLVSVMAALILAAQRSRLFRFHRVAIASAMSLAALGVATWVVGNGPTGDRALAGSGLVAAAWFAAASGLVGVRRRSIVPIAGALYALVGTAWVAIYIVAIRGFTVREAPAAARIESIAYWPFEIAQVVGVI